MTTLSELISLGRRTKVTGAELDKVTLDAEQMAMLAEALGRIAEHRAAQDGTGAEDAYNEACETLQVATRQLMEAYDNDQAELWAA